MCLRFFKVQVALTRFFLFFCYGEGVGVIDELGSVLLSLSFVFFFARARSHNLELLLNSLFPPSPSSFCHVHVRHYLIAKDAIVRESFRCGYIARNSAQQLVKYALGLVGRMNKTQFKASENSKTNLKN